MGMLFCPELSGGDAFLFLEDADEGVDVGVAHLLGDGGDGFLCLEQQGLCLCDAVAVQVF